MEDGEIMMLDEILEDPFYLAQYNERIKNMTDGSLNTEFADGHKAGGDMSENKDAGQEMTATQPEQSQSAAVNADEIIAQAQQKATEAAEKKMEDVFKSMLERQGLDADSISRMTADWKSKQRTPETVTAELTAANDALRAENETIKARMQAVAKGIPADKADKYIALASTYPDADKDLGKALDAALAEFPIAATPKEAEAKPPMWGGAGKTPVPAADAEKQKILDAAKAAMKIK